VIRGAYRRSIRVAYRDPVELADLAVDGDDLRESGIPAGPLLGKILHALLDRVVDDPGLNERQVLLAMALELYGQWRGDARPPSDHQ
jgi:tRNA nucleotidyltransferase (CCA-adding enzyme)